jgi:hypothetical protein
MKKPKGAPCDRRPQKWTRDSKPIIRARPYVRNFIKSRSEGRSKR